MLASRVVGSILGSTINFSPQIAKREIVIDSDSDEDNYLE